MKRYQNYAAIIWSKTFSSAIRDLNLNIFDFYRKSIINFVLEVLPHQFHLQHHLLMQLLNYALNIFFTFLPVHDILQRTYLLFVVQARYELFVFRETFSKYQWLTALNDELLLHFKPIPLLVKLFISFLLEIFI